MIAPPEAGFSIGAGCLAALVGMQVHGLSDAVTWGNKLAFIPWVIFAQITLLYRYTGNVQ